MFSTTNSSRLLSTSLLISRHTSCSSSRSFANVFGNSSLMVGAHLDFSILSMFLASKPSRYVSMTTWNKIIPVWVINSVKLFDIKRFKPVQLVSSLGFLNDSSLKGCSTVRPNSFSKKSARPEIQMPASLVGSLPNIFLTIEKILSYIDKPVDAIFSRNHRNIVTW